MSDLALFPADLSVPLIGSQFGDDTTRARRTDPATSHGAADSNDTKGSRAVVLAAFHERRYFADHELVEFLAATGYTPQRIRTARAELSAPESAVLVQAGESKTPSGRSCRVWTLGKDAA